MKSDSPKPDDIERLMNRIRKTPGYVYPFHTYLAEHDVSWLDAFQSWYEQVRAPRWLPLKYKELLFVTATLVERHETGMRTHIRKALELGATPDEVLETIEVGCHTAGGGVLVQGINALIDVLEGKTYPNSPQWVPQGDR